jgi:hypothetical protein
MSLSQITYWLPLNMFLWIILLSRICINRERSQSSMAPFIWLIICLIQLVFSAKTLFFSHKKSANNVFQPAYNSSERLRWGHPEFSMDTLFLDATVDAFPLDRRIGRRLTLDEFIELPCAAWVPSFFVITTRNSTLPRIMPHIYVYSPIPRKYFAFCLRLCFRINICV